MTTPEFRAGMAVVATDGLLGRVDALRAQLRSAAGTQQDLIVRGSDGILRRVPPHLVERVIDDTIYLTGSIASVPIEERLRVTTAEVELGVARVHKAVEEHLAHEIVALAFEEVELEHVPIDQVVDHHPAPFIDGDVLVVPLHREQAEVTEVWHDAPHPPTSPDPLAATDGEPSAPSGGALPPAS